MRCYTLAVKYAIYPPDYLSLVLRGLYLRFYSENRHMPKSHFDACFISGPLSKHNPTAIYYMNLILQERQLCPLSIRGCIVSAVQYHNNLPAEEQQPCGGLLERVQGPRYVLSHFTKEVLAHLWNCDDPPNFQSIFKLRELESPIPAHLVTLVTIPVTERVTAWTRSIAALRLTKRGYEMEDGVLVSYELEEAKYLRPNLADYGAPWLTRRLMVFLEIRLLKPTFFALGMSKANVTKSGIFKHGGAGVLSYTTATKGTLYLTALYTNVLKRALARTTPDSLIEEYQLQHRHHCDFSMFACLFHTDLLVYALKNRDISLGWIRAYVTNPDNMLGSSSRLRPSDNPQWNLPVQR